MFLANILDEVAPQGGNWFIWVLLGVLVLMLVYSAFSGKKRRQQAEEAKQKREAIEPGFNVMTIGGITGTVVSVNEEENSFVLETGSDDNKSYIKFDKLAIYSSSNPNEPVEETPVEEAPVEEKSEEKPEEKKEDKE